MGFSDHSEPNQELTGYLHPNYADSYDTVGTPQQLLLCGGWLLRRQIAGFPYYDGMGCYPRFLCHDWSSLHADLEQLGHDPSFLGTSLVTLALVTDPFAEVEPAYLHQTFNQVVFPFKEHYVADLQRPINEIANRRRRKHARRALRKITVEISDKPLEYLDEWVGLYNTLIERHQIKDFRKFSRRAFAKQLSIPGTIILRALSEGVAVGAQLYYLQGEVVYCHLGAFSQLGYELGASYALDWSSIEYFAARARWLDFGAGAGTVSDGTSGLNQYKRGWATDMRTAYFCGHIFDAEKYAQIVQAKGIFDTNYFPAYRKGEFG
jgi:hypothetical protein